MQLTVTFSQLGEHADWYKMSIWDYIASLKAKTLFELENKLSDKFTETLEKLKSMLGEELEMKTRSRDVPRENLEAMTQPQMLRRDAIVMLEAKRKVVEKECGLLRTEVRLMYEQLSSSPWRQGASWSPPPTFESLKPESGPLKRVPRSIDNGPGASMGQDHPPITRPYTDTGLVPLGKLRSKLRKAFRDRPLDTFVLDILFVCSRQDCEDPRDKVYGVLNISGLASHISVDYTKSIGQVYLDAAVVVLRDKQILPELLNHAAADLAMPTCPSWVPDWQHYLGPPAWSLTYVSFNASGSEKPQLRVDRKSWLAVRSLYVDRVSTHPRPDHHTQPLSSSPMIDSMRKRIDLYIRLRRQWLSERTVDTSWRVTMLDSAPESLRRLREEDCTEPEQALHRSQGGISLSPELSYETLSAMDGRLEANWPYKTHRGRVGALSTAGEIGNEIYVVAGCQVHFSFVRALITESTISDS